MKSTSINFVLAAEVASGRLPSNTVVGVGQDEEGAWLSAFVAFDRESGVAVTAEKTGRTRLNWRYQR